jgi:GNAT superfamily N-acetyltransferase
MRRELVKRPCSGLPGAALLWFAWCSVRPLATECDHAFDLLVADRMVVAVAELYTGKSICLVLAASNCSDPQPRGERRVVLNGRMVTLRVEFLEEVDRPAMCRMLEDSGDVALDVLLRYRHPSSLYMTFVAVRGDAIEGMLTGSFDSNVAESGAFESYELPVAPHAFLDRIHVHSAVRHTGVGGALIAAYAAEAAERGCTFVGGTIDVSSDPAARVLFFKRCDFRVVGQENFGARPSDLLGRTPARRRTF